MKVTRCWVVGDDDDEEFSMLAGKPRYSKALLPDSTHVTVTTTTTTTTNEICKREIKLQTSEI